MSSLILHKNCFPIQVRYFSKYLFIFLFFHTEKKIQILGFWCALACHAHTRYSSSLPRRLPTLQIFCGLMPGRKFVLGWQTSCEARKSRSVVVSAFKGDIINIQLQVSFVDRKTSLIDHLDIACRMKRPRIIPNKKTVIGFSLWNKKRTGGIQIRIFV